MYLQFHFQSYTAHVSRTLPRQHYEIMLYSVLLRRLRHVRMDALWTLDDLTCCWLHVFWGKSRSLWTVSFSLQPLLFPGVLDAELDNLKCGATICRAKTKAVHNWNNSFHATSTAFYHFKITSKIKGIISYFYDCFKVIGSH